MFEDIELLYIRDEPDTVVECRNCGDSAFFVGTLGILNVYRCFDCGRDTNQHYRE